MADLPILPQIPDIDDGFHPIGVPKFGDPGPTVVPLVAGQDPGGFQSQGVALRQWREQDRIFPNVGHRRFGHGERERQFIRGVDQEMNFVPKPVHDLCHGFPSLFLP